MEDNQDTATSLSLLLDLYGHEVRHAATGSAALQAVRDVQPDVLLLDIGLPGMNGWQVAKRISEQPPAKRPLLIALTGYGREEDRRRSREAGIDLHLLKPVDPEELAGTLGRLAASRIAS